MENKTNLFMETMGLTTESFFNKKKKEIYKPVENIDDLMKIQNIIKSLVHDYQLAKKSIKWYSVSDIKDRKEYDINNSEIGSYNVFKAISNPRSDEINYMKWDKEIRDFQNRANEKLKLSGFKIDISGDWDDGFIEVFVEENTIKESTDASNKERVELLEKIENKCKEAGGTVKISASDRKCFLGETSSNGGGPGGPDSICLAGFGKEFYNKAFNIIKEILLDYPSYRISKDNYFTMFLSYKTQNINELNESVYHENSSVIFESDQKSTIDKNFHKKDGGHFEFIDIHSPNADKYLKDDKYFIKNFKKIIDITNGEIAIDVNKDKLAGYIFIGGGNKNTNKNYGFIQTLEVFKEYRGYGLSNKLIDDALKKYNAIDLTVFKDNEVALNLYKKHGFVIIDYGNTKNKSDYWMKHKSKITKDDQIMESTDLNTNKSELIYPGDLHTFKSKIHKITKKYVDEFNKSKKHEIRYEIDKYVNSIKSDFTEEELKDEFDGYESKGVPKLICKMEDHGNIIHIIINDGSQLLRSSLANIIDDIFLSVKKDPEYKEIEKYINSSNTGDGDEGSIEFIFNKYTKESVEESDITDSIKKERIKLLENIENKIKESGGTINISSQSRKCFLGEQKRGGSPVSGPHSICLAGFGKDNYNKAFNIIKEVLKDYPSYKISKDNYYTMFLSYKGTKESVMEENVFFPEEDFIINLNKWSPGIPLWITGTSGDGKSTLARKMANEKNALIIPTDILLVRLGWDKEKWNKRTTNPQSEFYLKNKTLEMGFDYVLQHPELPHGLKSPNDSWPSSEILKPYYADFFKWIIENAKKNPKYKNRYIIVEGCDITYINAEFISKQPLIILGNSIIKSMYRRSKREANSNNTSLIKELFNQIRKYNKNVKYLDDHKNRFKNDVTSYISPDNTFYRVTYDGQGIYDAYKQNISEDSWKEFLNSKQASWLPKPPSYDIDNRSYFTKDGFDMFKKNTLPLMYQDLDKSKIFIDKITDLDNILYSDKYQVVIKNESDECDFEDLESYFKESEENTYIIKDAIYPIVEAVLSTPQGDRRFRKLVEEFINKNSSKLHTSGPVYMIPFTDRDKEEFFNCFNTNKNELLKPINEMTKIVNDKANWKLLKQNPIFCLFYQCIRYYTLNKNNTGVNTALAIYALSVYPSVFSHIFKYGANPDIMQYTIDNLTAKYIIKQAGNIFSALMMSIQNSYRFLRDGVIDSSDAEVIRFIARIRNDQKSMLKNVANNYYPNHEKGLRVKTQSETYGNEQLIDDNVNNTSVVEDVTRKIVISLITNGVDMTRASAAAKIAGVSISDLRFYLSKIVVEDRTMELQKFIESILFIFLYQEHHKPNEINEKKFLQFSMDLFRRTNSNDVNVVTIKESLQKWSDDTGVTVRFKRLASQINYKKGIFMYMILCIQYYNN